MGTLGGNTCCIGSSRPQVGGEPEFVANGTPSPQLCPVDTGNSPCVQRLHRGVGSVAVLMAPPPAWEGNWPELPELAAVHLVSIDAEGRPALDRPADHVAREGKPSQGLSKRFYGSTTGTVVILGCPMLEEATASVRIIEGLADGLPWPPGSRGQSSPVLEPQPGWLKTPPSLPGWQRLPTAL